MVQAIRRGAIWSAMICVCAGASSCAVATVDAPTDAAAGTVVSMPDAVDHAGAEALAAMIRIGSSRADVEALLGEPLGDGLVGLGAPKSITKFWYLRPIMEEASSPYAYGAIGVNYDHDRVLAKELNPTLR